ERVDVDHVLVLEPGERPRLALEVAPDRRVLHADHVDELERDAAIEPEVERLVDDAHGPLAELALEPVAPVDDLAERRPAHGAIAREMTRRSASAARGKSSSFSNRMWSTRSTCSSRSAATAASQSCVVSRRSDVCSSSS